MSEFKHTPEKDNTTTQAGNRLIGEFMGIGFLKEKFKAMSDIDSAIAWATDSYLHFDTSFDWLMPVLEKICRLKIGDGVVDYANPRTFGMINSESGQIMVRLNGFVLHEANTLIEATWLAVVDFIEWYNSEKSKIDNLIQHD